MSSKVCENRTTMKLRGFNRHEREDVEFVNKLFRVCESGVFMNLLCPLGSDSPKNSWGTAFDIQKSRSDVYMLSGGRILLDYETHLSPPVLAFKSAVAREGLWSRLEIHTLFLNKSLGIAGEWTIAKEQTIPFNTFLKPNANAVEHRDAMPSELAYYLFDIHEYV